MGLRVINQKDAPKFMVRSPKTLALQPRDNCHDGVPGLYFLRPEISIERQEGEEKKKGEAERREVKALSKELTERG